ncbi:Aureobasidin resistance protein Aur1 [Apophysomyces sp. BC1034]|nr:Aureobasidin resistance protein Aur1 [Apophysomyces sp. BC1015]KAG0175462.1 Aureobasidin resistance protein Aur1 [Apophysomyces sp. BC1021]KAG0185996.1 Aureobasidin resistance protein Aur1 [Apophysomyces sp. BC1034]
MIQRLSSILAPHYRWSYYDLKYLFLVTLLILDFIIIRSPNLVFRLVIGMLMISAMMIPYIRQFAIPALPIFTWLITFYACQFIPLDYRPTHIFVNILPTLERILYGASLSEIISRHTHPVLDILAWIPYGVMHFSFPFVLALILFIFGPPGALDIFSQSFGYMNIAGVLTQLLFPNASPWYEMSYGSAPADYSIPGEAGGLVRIDKILGLNLYGSTFGNSPLVFGAFPSLHSGSATIEMLFLVYLFPRLWPIGVAYTMWLWWCTMYLTHHYLIDLVGGSIYAFLTYFVARQFLPRVDHTKSTRLGYLGIEKASFMSFVYSLEHQKTALQPPDDEEALLKRQEYSSVHDPQAEPITNDVRIPPLRLRRSDSPTATIYDDDNYLSSPVSLTSGVSSFSNSEPNSPMSPRSPVTLPQLPFGTKC